MQLAEPKSRLLATREGVPFCGFRFLPGLRPRVLGATKRRFERRHQEAGRSDFAALGRMVFAWYQLSREGNTHGLRAAGSHWPLASRLKQRHGRASSCLAQRFEDAALTKAKFHVLICHDSMSEDPSLAGPPSTKASVRPSTGSRKTVRRIFRGWRTCVFQALSGGGNPASPLVLLCSGSASLSFARMSPRPAMQSRVTRAYSLTAKRDCQAR